MCALQKLKNSHNSSTFQKLKDSIIAQYNLSRTCQDLDMLKMKNNVIDAIIEVKTGTVSNNLWKPFIQKNYPHLPSNRLDDINYKALKKISEIASINLLVFRIKKDGLTEGIQIYTIPTIEDTLSINLLGNYKLDEFIDKSTCEVNAVLKNRKFNRVKDFNNPNFDSENNLYHFINQNNKLKNCYYIERAGIWSMLISNEITNQPIWLYIEFNIDLNSGFELNNENFILEFFPVLNLALKINIPFSVICYKNDLSLIKTYDYINDKFEIVIDVLNVDIDKFKMYYFNKIKD